MQRFSFVKFTYVCMLLQFKLRYDRKKIFDILLFKDKQIKLSNDGKLMRSIRWNYRQYQNIIWLHHQSMIVSF